MASQNFSSKTSLAILCFIILSFIVQPLKAGHGHFGSFRFRVQFEPEEEVSPEELETEQSYIVGFTLKNSHAVYSVDEVTVYASVKNKSNNQIIWSGEHYVPTIPTLGSVDYDFNSMPLNFQMAGDFELRLELQSEWDATPDDNIIFGDLTVTEKPTELPIEAFLLQNNFINPIQQENANSGFFQFNLPPIETPMFINVLGRLPGGTDNFWMVQNMPILPFPDNQELSTPVDFEGLGFSNGTNIESLEFDLQYTSTLITDSWEPTYWYPIEVGDLTIDINTSNEIEIDPPSDAFSEIIPIDWSSTQPITWHYRGCEVPNIDLNSTEHPGTSEGYAGDKNACGPASCANSMQWLENTNDNIPSNGINHREKMEELSELMGRENEAGVTTTQMVKGKLAYIDKHKLPIHVKYQSYFLKDSVVNSPNETYKNKAHNQTGSGGKPDFDWIKSEMEKGEDVEIMFGWYDKDGKRHGGHWVALSGVSDVGTGKGFYFKDDLNQGSEGGTRQVYVNWVEGDNGWSRLAGLKGANNYCWVESAISESFDSTITHKNDRATFKLTDWTNIFPFRTNLMGEFEYSAPPSEQPIFINIWGFNAITQQAVQIISNMVIPASNLASTISTYFDFGLMGYQETDEPEEAYFDVRVSDWAFTIEDHDPPKLYDQYDTYELDTELMSFKLIAPLEIESKEPPFPPNFEIEIPIVGTVFTSFRRDSMPNIDLDSSKYQPSSTYAGDLNACVPTATANSMHWLEQVHQPRLNQGTSARDKLVELSKNMKREDEEGVNEKEMIEGKLKFIDENRLPIRVKFQSDMLDTNNIASPVSKYGHFARNDNNSNYMEPTFDYLKQEIDEGEDVELIIDYFDTDSNKYVGAHAMTVSGYYQYGDKKGIYVYDDGFQDGEGGLREVSTEWQPGGTRGATLSDMSYGNVVVSVRSIVSESYDSTITFKEPGINIFQLDWSNMFEEPSTLQAALTYEALPSDSTRFINLWGYHEVIDSNVLLLSNVLIPPVDDTTEFSSYFDLGSLGIEEGEIIDTLYLDTRITEWVFTTEDQTPPRLTPYPVETITPNYAVIEPEGTEFKNPPLAPNFDFTLPDSKLRFRSYYRDSMINMDLDSSKYQPDGEYAGDWNACVPTATANSMQWLEQVHAPHLNQGTTTREKLKELSKNMKRANNSGVMEKEMIEGKLKFIDDNKLPIRVKFQSDMLNTENINSPVPDYENFGRNDNENNNAEPTFEWLKKELEDGEDVELIYDIFDRRTNRYTGAHAVTVSGYYELGGAKGIYFFDDLKQGEAGGQRQVVTGWDDSGTDPVLSNISTANKTRSVRSVVAESYDTTITFTKPPEYTGVRVIDQFIEDTGEVLKDKLSVVITPLYEGLKYIGIFGENEGEPVKVIKDLPLSQESGSIELLLDKSVFTPDESSEMGKADVRSLSSLKLGIQTMTTPSNNGTDSIRWETYAIESGSYRVSNDATSSSKLSTSSISFESASLFGEISQQKHINLDTIDLINNNFGPGSPANHAGDINAGGPANAATALKAIHKRNSNLNLPLEMRNMYYDLSRLSKRANNTGVNTEQLIKSSLSLNDSLKVPISIQFQSHNLNHDVLSPNEKYNHKATNQSQTINVSPQWDWIQSKVDSGSVIISYGFYNNNGERISGQWATVKAYISGSQYKSLILSIDMDQIGNGGMTNIISTWEEKDGNAYLKQLSTESITCWIESAIAFIEDPDMKFIPLGFTTTGNLQHVNLLAYKNPSGKNENVHFRFTSKGDNKKATISIFDLQGKLIKRLATNTVHKGSNTIVWDGKDKQNHFIPTGTYIVQLNHNQQTQIIKIMRE